MTERAAHLVDHVFPDVPVRQWVLSMPPGIRYLLAWDHDLCKAVVGVLLREVSRHLRDRARARGLVDPRGGAVAVVQRFGGALNLNVHVYALVLDGPPIVNVGSFGPFGSSGGIIGALFRFQLMSLAPGSQLGVYEVLAAIGQGGMGEVYRARDTKLELMFEGQYAMPLLSRTYDMSPDGRRFLMIAQDKRTDKASPLQLVVVQNRLGELKRLVPTN